MIDAVKTAEANAPRMTDAKLPSVVHSLEFIPDGHRQKYSRAMDGSFHLSWLNVSDVANNFDPVELASGRIQIVEDGETPATLAAASEASATAQRQFEEALTAGTADLQKRQAVIVKEALDRKTAREDWLRRTGQ